MIQKLLFTGIFACLLSCGFSTVGGDPHSESKCQGTLKEHPDELDISIRLGIFRDSIYKSSLFFDVFRKNNPNTCGGCYVDYEYKYASNKEIKKIHKYETFYDVLDPDEHVRFSLFDKNNVEKSYDIDLSEIIHSYTFKGNSVEIKMPNEGETEIRIQCPYCRDADYSSLCQGSLACHYKNYDYDSVIVGTDTTWEDNFRIDQYLSNQSSFGTDSIHIIWRNNI